MHCRGVIDVPVFLMTSGARYSGVPHNVYVSPILISERASSRWDVQRTILHLLGEPKIDQLKMTLGVDQNVLWLQITVCDAFSLVQEL